MTWLSPEKGLEKAMIMETSREKDVMAILQVGHGTTTRTRTPIPVDSLLMKASTLAFHQERTRTANHQHLYRTLAVVLQSQ